MSITAGQLRRIMPNLAQADAERYLTPLNAAMHEFHITDTAARAAAFLAQIAHESAELRYWTELATGSAYEGRADLGNTNPGDGRRYKGRGPIQVTGRANYREFGAALGVPLETHPELAATTAVGFRVAGLFWKKHDLNAKADAGDFRGITRAINGGLTGEADREKYYHRALSVLAA